MLSSRMWLGPLILVAAGCTSGEVVSVTVDATPAIANVAHVSVVATVSQAGATHTSRHSFDTGGPSTTPITFGIAVPQAYTGGTMTVEVALLDGPGNTLGTGKGSVTIGNGITPLDVVIGGGASLCASGGPPYCDGFEGANGTGGLADFWIGPAITSGGMAMVDSTHAKRGKYALLVQNNALMGDAGAGPNFAILAETKFIPTDLFVRAFVWVPAMFDTAPGAIFLFEQKNTPFSQIVLNLDSNAYSVYDSIDGSIQHATGVTLGAGQWVCVEWEVTVGVSGISHLWVEDQPVAGVGQPVNSVPPSGGPFDQVAVGLVTSLGGTTARQIWIDEVMIDSNRITCAK
jgi:hypothetical protein